MFNNSSALALPPAGEVCKVCIANIGDPISKEFSGG
jgi:hypothetical protein